jgi:hypothetical protein
MDGRVPCTHSQVLTWWFAPHVPEKVRNEVILSPRSVGALLLGAANSAIGKEKVLGERYGLCRVGVLEVAVAVGGFPLVERPSIE